MTSTGDGEGSEGRPDDAADPADKDREPRAHGDRELTGPADLSERRPLDDEDVARRWKELTAELQDLSSLGERAEREALPPPRKPRPEPGARPRQLGPRDYAEPAGAEDVNDFVPEEPAQLSSADPVLAIGWVAAVAPLLGLLFLVIFAAPSRLLVMTLGAVTLCGVGLLLWKLPTHRQDDGDGAVV